MNKDEAIKKIDQALGDRHEHLYEGGILDHGSVSKNAADIIDQVKAGNVNPLEAFVALKHMEETCKLANKKIKDLAIDEVSNYGPEAKDLSIHGANVQLRNGAGRWKFDHIKEIQDLEDQIKELKEKHKQAFKMQEKGNQLISDHGEIITPANYTPGAEVLAIKLKK